MWGSYVNINYVLLSCYKNKCTNITLQDRNLILYCLLIGYYISFVRYPVSKNGIMFLTKWLTENNKGKV